MDRRAFIQWLGLGWLASALPGCGGKLLASRQATSGATQAIAEGVGPLAQAQTTAYVAVGRITDLDRAGHLLNRQTPFGPVLVVRDPATPQSLQAVNPVCPHQGCSVDWRSGQQDFHCPCHGARFAADGALLQGPARKPLESYSVRLENGTIMVAPGAGGQTATAPTGTGEPGGDRFETDEAEADDDSRPDHEGEAEDDRDSSWRQPSSATWVTGQQQAQNRQRA